VVDEAIAAYRARAKADILQLRKSSQIAAKSFGL
jgi:hypothetical protein